MNNSDTPKNIPASQNRQAYNAMKGFSEEFLDPEDYITKITYSIWEGKNIGGIRDWYDHDCVIRTPHGIIRGIEPVITGTENTLNEFPDRKLLPEDIIIGYPEEGFLSSHRIRSPASHMGNGYFGEATGHEVTMLTIADCLCRRNTITEEWLVRDQASIAKQVGVSPAEMGRRLGELNPDWYSMNSEEMVAAWEGNSELSCTSCDAAQPLIESLKNLWEKGDAGILSKTHHRAVRFEGPQGEIAYGRKRTARIIASMASCFPGGRVRIHHATCSRTPERPIRISLRWSYTGVHRYDGRYGNASGKSLVLLAVTHAELRDGKVVNEWMVCDELALYAQVATKTIRRNQ